jgi:hypothetical protein
MGLPGDRRSFPCGSHSLEDKAFVGRMLVDYDQAVLSLGNDVGRRDLAPRDAERILRDFGDSGLGPRRWRMVEQSLGFFEDGRCASRHPLRRRP